MTKHRNIAPSLATAAPALALLVFWTLSPAMLHAQEASAGKTAKAAAATKTNPSTKTSASAKAGKSSKAAPAHKVTYRPPVAASSAANATTATTAPGAGDLILQARDAVRNGDRNKLDRLLPQTREHVLAGYLEYWQLRLRIEQATADEVEAFFIRHPGEYLSEVMRHEWLRILARRGDWSNFARHYAALVSTLVNDEPDVLCYGLQSRHQAGDMTALSEMRVHWQTARDLPEGCQALIEPMRAAGLLGTPQLWERFRLLAEANQMPALRRFLSVLPQDERPDLARLDALMASPARWLDRSADQLATRPGRELVIVALARLARSDPQAAAAQLDARLRAALSAEQQAWALAHIATVAARKHLPEALEWFRQAAALAGSASGMTQERMTQDQLAWRTRIALRLGNWSEVKAAIDAMTPLARAESTWTYWLGRAAQQQGRHDEARQLFVRIAAEHSFYGRLAAEEGGQTLSLPRAVAIEARESQAAANHPGLRRALALFERNMRVEGVREWNWALRGMDDRQLLAAADLARSNKVWDRAINTADRTQQTHDYSLRFLAPYREALGREARAQSVEEPFVLGLVRQESRFIAEVKSGAGAAGLMQLMPATARWVAKRAGMHDFQWSRVTDVDINARLGTYYLRQVLSELDSHPVLASAAYNAGPGRARNWRGDRPLEGAIYAESIPFTETRDYVKKVMSNTVYYAAVLGGEARSLKSRLGTVAARGTPSDQLANKDLP